MEKESAVLEVSGLTFSYEPGKLPNIFDDITFSLRPGEILTILGPNGAGKSTLFNCISGDLTPQSGEIMLCGKKLESYSVREASQRLGYVPQIQNPAFDYSVREYLVMGRNPYIGELKSPTAEDYKIVEDVLEEFHLLHLGDSSVRKISGGERQQIQIARALVQQTDVIMMDEPANHLDYGNQLKVLNIISKLARERDIAVLLTTHTPDHAILLGGQTAILSREYGMKVGQTDEIVTEENLCSIYQAKLYLVDIPVVHRKACIADNLDC